jgi:outer membrane protein OmpA-like peptidoglycan-associated protein
MSRYGKCQNFSGCLLAYRGEETEVDSDQPFICAECGKPLTEVRPPSAMWLRYLYGLIGLGVIGAAVVFAVPSLRTKVLGSKEPAAESTPSAPSASNTTPPLSQTTPETSPESAPAPSPVETPTISPNAEPVAEPPRFVSSPERIDLDVTKTENKAVKDEVLTRIDLMPNVSEANKDKLYQAVERARSMGKILTIPFASGKTELSAADIEALRTELAKPELSKLRDDPTAVFVILGYADPKGDAKKNIAYSQARGEAVLKVMRDRLGVINVMHTIGMGGSKLLDAQNLEKNRIVEIWAVLP